MTRLVLGLALCSSLGACGSVGPIPDPRWVGTDGRAVDGQIRVFGEGSTIVADQLSLATWPELGPVGSEVTVEADGVQNTIAILTPDQPLTDRWYAVRWARNEVADARAVGAIPLQDGSAVWRFYGVPVPEVSRIIAPSGAPDVLIELSTNVVPAAGHSVDDVATITQAAVACEPFFPDGAPRTIGSRLTLRCTPELDWTMPVRVRVEGLEDADGVAVDPLDVTMQFAAGEERVLAVPSALTPPAVPASLCAGVACE